MKDMLAICRGCESGCRRSATAHGPEFADRLTTLITDKDIPGRLQSRLGRSPLHHHYPKISVSACPNGCSRPHIADVGFIGASYPIESARPCEGCGGCVAACQEGAIRLEFGSGAARPVMDLSRCLGCGECARACPTGRLAPGEPVWRVVLGGRLGRRPVLAREMAAPVTTGEAVALAARALDFYLDRFDGHTRFGAMLEQAGGVEALP